MLGPRENYNFWWVYISVCYISNGVWIALIRGLWKTLWSFYQNCADWTKNWHTCVLAQFWEPYCGNHILCCTWKFFGTSKYFHIGILGLHLRSRVKVMYFWSELTCFGANWVVIAISMWRILGGKFQKFYCRFSILFFNFQ